MPSSTHSHSRLRAGFGLLAVALVAALYGNGTAAQQGISSRKLIVGTSDTAAVGAIAQRQALLYEADYGSFRLVVVDERRLGGPEAVDALGAWSRNDMNLVVFNGCAIDTTRPATAACDLPPDLRQAGDGVGPGEAPARVALDLTRPDPDAPVVEPGRALADSLFVVQFIGPIQDAWLSELASAGIQVVAYVPANAYVVEAHGRAADRLRAWRASRPHVQFVGAYQPGYRLTPGLRARAAAGDGGEVDVTVQLVQGPGAMEAVDVLEGLATSSAGAHRVMNFLNVALRVPASRLATMAQVDGVFAIEERRERRRLDEIQGQIMAGNLTGTRPTGPGYLAWLTARGFTAAQFGSFVVNVVDDAPSLQGHPDMASSRVAFQLNPTSQTGAQGGHGFLNAMIVGGLNALDGSSYRDASGYRYGLGIAPYARVGVTAIFGNGNATPTQWESTAWGRNARISSNSWGYDSTRYDSAAQEFDRIVRDAQPGSSGAQPMTVVFAAGNDGPTTNTVGSPGTAKNIITVGASENYRMTGTDGCGVPNSQADSANDVVGFSSRGPVNPSGGDGRVKPDLVAPGTHIQAGVPQSSYDGSSVCDQYWPLSQRLYGWSSGTSHSTPAVAGAAALVYQHFLNEGRSAPSPAMVKAYLMNAAAYMTGTGANDTLPSNNQGMGRVDLGRAFDDVPRRLTDQTVVFGATGQTHRVSGSVVDTGAPVRVTLAWTDAPGSTTGAPWVNNLDLDVTVGGQTYRGNVFAKAWSVTGGTADLKNNVESVVLPAGVSGAVTVTVRAANIAGDGVPGNADTTDQDFALVVYNVGEGGGPAGNALTASPASLTFAAAVGQAPASQTIALGATGAALAWTATSSAAWLSVSPASGTTPASLSASVSGALSAGTYDATITVASAGASNSPLAVPVRFTVSGGATDLLVNGGFEGGLAPWSVSGDVSHRSDPALAHTGAGFAVLGGRNYARGQLRQRITIPAGATSAAVSFWLSVTSTEAAGARAYDTLQVEIRDTRGTLLKRLATYSNQQKGAPGSWTGRGTFSLLAYRGRTIELRFNAATDSTLPTTFNIDDVAVK